MVLISPSKSCVVDEDAPVVNMLLLGSVERSGEVEVEVSGLMDVITSVISEDVYDVVAVSSTVVVILVACVLIPVLLLVLSVDVKVSAVLVDDVISVVVSS